MNREARGAHEQGCVLLLVNEEAHVRELSRVADLLLATDDLRPVVFMEDRLAGLGEPGVFVERGIEVLGSTRLATGQAAGWSSPRRRKLRSLVASLLARLAVPRRILRRWPLGLFSKDDIVLVDINRNLMLKRAAVSDALLKSRPWQAVVMCEDNVELDTGIWIDAAKRHGIRSIIVPYTISNTAEFAESYVGHAPYQLRATPQNRLVGRLFPEWVLDYKGRQFLRSNYAKVVAVEQLNLTPPNPWLLNSGYADAIAVESDAMQDYYRAAGLPAGQLVTTGSMTDDVMAKVVAEAPQRRQALAEQHGLPADRPLLLCALPPDQNTYDRPGCEFANFDDLIGFWGDCLAEVKDWNVIVRPHPKTASERVDLLRRKGLAVSYDDTALLVPLCDLYVAAVSATIRWAVACGKPVINYDVYQYGYEDYRGVRGVQLVNLRTEFREALCGIAGNAARRAELAAFQRADAARWGCLDGASGRPARAELTVDPESAGP
jgi:hypothetical protein